jgi:hypothetical protein
MIYDENVVKTYWNVKHNGTLGVKNTKFWIINQHMNAISHMQSMEIIFTLVHSSDILPIWFKHTRIICFFGLFKKYLKILDTKANFQAFV